MLQRRLTLMHTLSSRGSLACAFARAGPGVNRILFLVLKSWRAYLKQTTFITCAPTAGYVILVCLWYITMSYHVFYHANVLGRQSSYRQKWPLPAAKDWGKPHWIIRPKIHVPWPLQSLGHQSSQDKGPMAELMNFEMKGPLLLRLLTTWPNWQDLKVLWQDTILTKTYNWFIDVPKSNNHLPCSYMVWALVVSTFLTATGFKEKTRAMCTVSMMRMEWCG